MLRPGFRSEQSLCQPDFWNWKPSARNGTSARYGTCVASSLGKIGSAASIAALEGLQPSEADPFVQKELYEVLCR
jgi:hypothetical protein